MNKLQQTSLRFLGCIALFLTSSSVFAHATDAGLTGGMEAGFLHPLFGLDHLCAMICVGMLSSKMGGKFILTIPLFFIVSMMIGFVMGENGMIVPMFETWIALSVLLFATILLFVKNINWLWVAFPLFLFGISHGFAHGVEIGTTLNPREFQKGFFLASVLIHMVGITFGLAPNTKWDFLAKATKGLTAVIGLYGAYLLVV